ncbi:citrulline utilization hydrolase CtlX [Xanthovirga aplysinae]|uniref:citrulline utilization hydrolase CtlX n=1 Tax=Xanthovirga aplysinae TaxID=2529853 RepID=UPI001CA44DC6|nr:arginine deiminase-related protein [Xanthovirga aplysinae]
MSKQITSTIMMIRPVSFRYNEQTAVNNYYQKVLDNMSPQEANAKAQQEFDTFVSKLRGVGVQVVVVNDTKEPDTPDSIFPNNWVSFHADGRVALYPMYAENRRLERRKDILQNLKEKGYELHEVIDFSGYEAEDIFLEGTGSLILDRENKIAYAALSLRTDAKILDEFCEKFEYKAVTFTANQTVEGKRLPIYHTNVMMCVADQFAILCADSIDDDEERRKVIDTLESSNKKVIFISEEQKHQFAGNMLQVANENGEKFLVMSGAAYKSLTPDQIKEIESFCPILHSSLDTIEACGGGSARCMMAEVFLPKK